MQARPVEAMKTATITAHGVLGNFLARGLRGRAIAHAYARAATMKQAVESLGVPHTEIGRITVNDQPATLERTIRAGDRVEVFPHEPGAAPFESPLIFLADAHMGALARMLRMLGLDTIYDNGFDDQRIVEIASRERRVVLTRDRELLKRRELLRGCFVHELRPEAQLREVARRYAIEEHMRPFTLCLHCNVLLERASAEQLAARVPERIRQQYTLFMHCAACTRVYWQGSHWERMRSVLAEALELPAHSVV